MLFFRLFLGSLFNKSSRWKFPVFFRFFDCNLLWQITEVTLVAVCFNDILNYVRIAVKSVVLVRFEDIENLHGLSKTSKFNVVSNLPSEIRICEESEPEQIRFGLHKNNKC